MIRVLLLDSLFLLLLFPMYGVAESDAETRINHTEVDKKKNRSSLSRSLQSGQQKFDGIINEGNKAMFYIYDWPSYLDDVWPPPNATLHKKSGYDHGFYGNRG